METLFHEFGHALQHMLTEQADGLVSGIRGIEWDAVELPSQFMENWCAASPQQGLSQELRVGQLCTAKEQDAGVRVWLPGHMLSALA